ncbi:WG repeat-containing protein [Micromonospora schwarzwaldensis]|uniref:WG repeat-containing protein n=1 Tax=Micromonospora sp. DSM 45708 TaxID=3111767 RepID=UPI0031E3861F
MSGWGSWREPAEPAWALEPTHEWQPQFPGQRYPGDIGLEHLTPPPRRRAVVGRAEVRPVSPAPEDAHPISPAPTDAYPVSPAGSRGTYPVSPAAPRGTYPVSPAAPRGTYPVSPAAPDEVRGPRPVGASGEWRDSPDRSGPDGRPPRPADRTPPGPPPSPERFDQRWTRPGAPSHRSTPPAPGWMPEPSEIPQPAAGWSERRRPAADAGRDAVPGRPTERHGQAGPARERGTAAHGEPARDGWREPGPRPPTDRREPVDGRWVDGTPRRDAAVPTGTDRYGAPRPAVDQRWDGQHPPPDRIHAPQGEWPVIERRPRTEPAAYRPDERSRPPADRPVPDGYPVRPTDDPRRDGRRPEQDGPARPESRDARPPAAHPDHRPRPAQWPVRPDEHAPARAGDVPARPVPPTRPDEPRRSAPPAPGRHDEIRRPAAEEGRRVSTGPAVAPVSGVPVRDVPGPGRPGSRASAPGVSADAPAPTTPTRPTAPARPATPTRPAPPAYPGPASSRTPDGGGPTRPGHSGPPEVRTPHAGPATPAGGERPTAGPTVGGTAAGQGRDRPEHAGYRPPVDEAGPTPQTSGSGAETWFRPNNPATAGGRDGQPGGTAPSAEPAAPSVSSGPSVPAEPVPAATPAGHVPAAAPTDEVATATPAGPERQVGPIAPAEATGPAGDRYGPESVNESAVASVHQAVRPDPTDPAGPAGPAGRSDGGAAGTGPDGRDGTGLGTTPRATERAGHTRFTSTSVDDAEHVDQDGHRAADPPAGPLAATATGVAHPGARPPESQASAPADSPTPLTAPAGSRTPTSTVPTTDSAPSAGHDGPATTGDPAGHHSTFTDDRAVHTAAPDATALTGVDAAPVPVTDDAPHTGTDVTSQPYTDEPPRTGTDEPSRTGTDVTSQPYTDEPSRTESGATADAVVHVQPGPGTDAVASTDAVPQATAVEDTTVPSGAAGVSTAPAPGTGGTAPNTDGREQVVAGDVRADAAAPGPAPVVDGPTGDEPTGDGPTDANATDQGPSGSGPRDVLRPASGVAVADEEQSAGAVFTEDEPRRVALAEEDSPSTPPAAADSASTTLAEGGPVDPTPTPAGHVRSAAATDTDPAGPTRAEATSTDSRAPGTTPTDSTNPAVTNPAATDAPRTHATPTDTDAPTTARTDAATTEAPATPAGIPTPRTTRADATTGTTVGERDAPEPVGASAARADAGPVRTDPAGRSADPRTPGSGPAGDVRADLPGDEPAPPRPVDPERALAAVHWRLHPETLREETPDPAELRRIRDGLTGKLDTALDNRSRARLLSLRAVASRVLGDADDAVADARLALTYAEATGELRRTALARARLAEVLRWRGEYAEADRLFAEANSTELPDRLRALLHEHAGRCCYDQGRLTEACLHFERALDLRRGEDAALNARTLVALDAVAARAASDGFGPAPRGRAEVLGTPRYPVATFDEEQELWGYADADGELVIGHRYAEAQPFHEGLAWVRRPEASRWALIDTSGAALIEANNGYRSVGAFAEGLSWVSMDGKGRWMAVDRMNIVQIPPGYEEVRPFRNGLAAVRQNGGWGAVDHAGEVVVPTRYHGLGTPLADGRHLDGFTEEGLAVVELAGRRGVVDRNGRVRVAPAYPTLVIHPVAFLVTTETGRWGALDRHGEPLIDPVHPGRAAVAAEIDRLLADANPVL